MTATASRTTAPSAWKSPAASYYLLAAATSILLLVGLAVVLSSSSIVSIRHEGGNPYALFLIQLAALVVGVVCLVFGSRMSVQWWKRMGPLALYGLFTRQPLHVNEVEARLKTQRRPIEDALDFGGTLIRIDAQVAP